MADKERRLGKGLDTLISAARDKSLNIDLVRKTGHRVQPIPVEEIKPNPFQPRREFPVEELNELVESLRAHGLLQPIVVRRMPAGYEIIAGERRWRAARELGWGAIDGVVVDADDRKMLSWALVENLQRQALGPMELATAMEQLMAQFGLTQEEVAKTLSMSRPNVANHVRLLDLPPKVKDCVSRGTISFGAAKAILSLQEPEQQEEIARKVDAGLMTVRQVEELARLRSKPAAAVAQKPPDPNLQAVAEEIQALLATKVVIRGRTGRGRIVVHYSSARQLDGLVRRLRCLGTNDGREGSAAEGTIRV